MEFIEIAGAFFYFILGTIIGSFLNVVLLRYDMEKSILGRSMCLSCGRELRWFELIPVLSFIFQLGRCRNCRNKLLWQYPLIEFFTGLIFLGVFLKFSNLFLVSMPQFTVMSVYSMAIFSILIVIFVYDIKHKIIPDDLVYTFATLSLASIFFDSSTFQIFMPTLLPFLAGPIFFLFFFFIWFFSRGKWMGLGDGKLALGIGWFLGPYAGATAIILSFWLGALVSIALMTIPLLNLRRKKLTMKSEISFGPFLIIGILLVFFFNINILNFIL
ncbi:MAG: prepilin peptidase [Candidatus Pacebacteria bacterium]|jgi:prepilin signal peptidase PulO-like enzyme (type II secretory pathway)|nr:prepilin peptidase [Candidatus Paceibacterota bacterium]|tara:strand:+ start:36442 stop:37257 length:816 start_codon:yes stop_codon:yes gene_type:complete